MEIIASKAQTGSQIENKSGEVYGTKKARISEKGKTRKQGDTTDSDWNLGLSSTDGISVYGLFVCFASEFGISADRVRY